MMDARATSVKNGFGRGVSPNEKGPVTRPALFI